jgi:hypothetical protein
MTENKGPMGLPEGTVRAIIALIVVTGTLVYFIIYKNIPDVLGGFTIAILTYYFGYRQGQALGTAEGVAITCTNGNTTTPCTTTNDPPQPM